MLAALAKVTFVSETSGNSSNARAPWWLWGNVLSLDAPLVAVGWQWMLAKVFAIRLPFGCYALLWMTVWCIYMLDRVLDGFAEGPVQQRTARHAFYHRHRHGLLQVVLPVMVMFTAWMALTMIPLVLVERGMVLGFMVGLYLLHYAGQSHRRIYRMGNAGALLIGLWLVWWGPLQPTLGLVDVLIWQGTAMEGLPVSPILWTLLLALLPVLTWRGWRPGVLRLVPKEILCGCFFAFGCTLSVHFYSLDEVAGPLSMSTWLLALMAALNCIGIACQERDLDAHKNSLAITQTWPQLPQWYGRIIAAVLGFLMVLWFKGSGSAAEKTALTATISGVLALGLVHGLAARMPSELPRVLMDAALLAPVAVVWCLI